MPARSHCTVSRRVFSFVFDFDCENSLSTGGCCKGGTFLIIILHGIKSCLTGTNLYDLLYVIDEDLTVADMTCV